MGYYHEIRPHDDKPKLWQILLVIIVALIMFKFRVRFL